MIRVVSDQKSILYIFIAIIMLYQSALNAAGFGSVEHSASSMGNALAGSAAIAEDASTIQYNPAGLSRLSHSQLLVAEHFISPKIRYSDQGSITATSNELSGTKNSDGGVEGVLPNLYLSAMINRNITLGLGINVPFGLTTEYDEGWVGRYHGIKSDLLIINVNPSLALRLTDEVSIGVGFNIQKLNVTLTSAVDFGGICNTELPSATCTELGLDPQQNDGFASVTGESWSTGINFGLLINLTDRMRLGLAYRSGVFHEVTGDVDFQVPAGAQIFTTTGLFTDTKVQSNISLPVNASVSLVHSFMKDTELLADISWTQWSSLNELRVSFPDSPQSDALTTFNWDDAYRFSLGINHYIRSGIKLRGGVAVDQSPITKDEYRTPRIPGNDQIWTSIGFGVDLLKGVHIDVAYAHLFVATGKSNNTFESSIPAVNHSLIGEYESSTDILSVQLIWTI